jgi:PPM family protein phosphatase
MSLTIASWTGTGLTDKGVVRLGNQDTFAIDNALGLWIVADGMGGHVGGGVASDLAVTAILKYFRDALHHAAQETNLLQDATTRLTAAIVSGKTAIQQRVAEEPALSGMGTTVVVAWLFPAPISTLAIAHVGDSRAYLIREGRLTALTTDHSFVQRLVAEGHISVEDSLTHPKRNVLVNAVGSGYPSIPDVALHPLMPQDVVLLCTDGLTKMLSDADILSIIHRTRNNLEEGCRQLIQQANAQGGKDNTTVLLIGQPS